jgi:hypothetical protein
VNQFGRTSDGELLSTSLTARMGPELAQHALKTTSDPVTGGSEGRKLGARSFSKAAMSILRRASSQRSDTPTASREFKPKPLRESQSLSAFIANMKKRSGAPPCSPADKTLSSWDAPRGGRGTPAVESRTPFNSSPANGLGAATNPGASGSDGEEEGRDPARSPVEMWPPRLRRQTVVPVIEREVPQDAPVRDTGDKPTSATARIREHVVRSRETDAP